MEDAPLQRRLATDLDGAFEQVVLTFQDRLYRFALRLTGNGQDAEEIAQDAFVRAYHALDRYSSDRIRSLALQAWLYQITLNVFRNRVRRRRVQQVPLDGHLPERQEPELPEQVAEDEEQRRDVARLLSRLPERYRTAVVLRHIEDLSYAEMADVLDQPVGTIKANVHRGLQMLRKTLTEEKSEVKV